MGMQKFNDEEELIYFAVSNLIKDCYESLEAINKLPQDKKPEQEEIDMIQYILSRALTVEEELHKELDGKYSTIQRPDWAQLEADK